MATQEQLILAQLGAKEADIYKPDVDTGSGFVQDITAGIMGAQAFDESVYALEGAVKDFRKDYYKGDIKEDSLMGKIGLKAFGPNVKYSELSAEERREIRRGPQFEARSAVDITSSDAFKFNPDLYVKNLEDDYAVAENVELSSNGEMITVPFDVKKEIIDPALKAEVDVPTTFVGPVGNVSQSEYDNIYKGKTSDEEKLPISEKNVFKLPGLYSGMMETTSADRTGYNFSNVNISDIPGTNYDLEAVQSAQAAAGVTGFFTGRSQEEIIDKQNEIANKAINKLTTG